MGETILTRMKSELCQALIIENDSCVSECNNFRNVVTIMNQEKTGDSHATSDTYWPHPLARITLKVIMVNEIKQCNKLHFLVTNYFFSYGYYDHYYFSNDGN